MPLVVLRNPGRSLLLEVVGEPDMGYYRAAILEASGLSKRILTPV